MKQKDPPRFSRWLPNVKFMLRDYTVWRTAFLVPVLLLFLFSARASEPAAFVAQDLSSLLARGHEAVAQKDYNAARSEYRKVLGNTNSSPLFTTLARLAIASTFTQEGNLEAAREEYAGIASISGIAPHHRWEAQERLRELDRRAAGLPPRDPTASRVRVPELPPSALQLYVAVNGADSNAGTSEKPFATLERARDEIRALKKSGHLPNGSVVVLVKGGQYQAARTFRLEQQDSGTAKSPIVYRAAGGEKPSFRGGVRLRNFQPVQHSDVSALLPAAVRSRVRQLDLKSHGITNLLPLKLGGFASGHGFRTHPAHELFFNGKAMQLARGPNDGFLRIRDVVVKDGTKGYDRSGSKTGQFISASEIPQAWTREPDLMLYGYWFWDWADSYEKVAAIDLSRRQIELAKPWHNYGYSIGAPFYAINATSELDQPGEWYLDRATQTLFFLPPSEVKDAVVEFSLLPETMVQLDNVSHVRFENLTWELGSADAVRVDRGTNVLFAGCTVRHFAGNGIEIHGGLGHGLLSCDIFSMGRGGTSISGGDRKSLTPGGHFIENCEIHDLSRIDHTYTPTVILSGVGNRVAHNRFHNVLSSALRVGGNDHIVEYNEVFNVVRESDDQGGADMYGNPTYRGNVFRFNYWHHIGKWNAGAEQPKCGQAGIRLDDAISGTVVYGNIFEHCSVGKVGFGGVQIHGGKDNVIDNNLFVDCAAAISFTPWSESRWKEFVGSALEHPEIDRALYLQRYPDLARLLDDANENRVLRNHVVRSTEFLRRSSKKIHLADNFVTLGSPSSGGVTSDLLDRPGFAPIPVTEIGLYADPYRADFKHSASNNK